MNDFIYTTEFYSGFLSGGILTALFIFYRMWFRVEEGHLGVVSSFGAAHFENEEQRQLKLFGPGLHFKWPWQHVREFSVMERITDLISHSGRTLHAVTSDATVLKLESKLRIQPVKENLYSYLFDLKRPVEHIQELFKCLLRNEVANFEGSYDGIRKQRHILNKNIAEVSKVHIGTKYGVNFNSVDITDILPPEELALALNAVQNAQANVDALYARAEADRDVRLAAAQQAVEIATNRARAAETEILTLGQVLEELHKSNTIEEYLQRRKVEVYSASKWSFVNKSNYGDHVTLPSTETRG